MIIIIYIIIVITIIIVLITIIIIIINYVFKPHLDTYAVPSASLDKNVAVCVQRGISEVEIGRASLFLQINEQQFNLRRQVFGSSLM